VSHFAPLSYERVRDVRKAEGDTDAGTRGLHNAGPGLERRVAGPRASAQRRPSKRSQSMRFSIAIALCLTCGAAARAQTWQPAGVLPTGGAPRLYAAGVTHNGTIYTIGGTPWQNGADQDGVVHKLAGGVWYATAPLGGLGPIIGEAAGVDDLGRMVIYGGYVDGDGGPGWAAAPARAARIPATATGNTGSTDSWQTIAPMPTPAADGCAVYDGLGRILVFGGINAAGNARLTNVASYDVASNTWSDAAVPDLPVALSGARAVLGADGRVYVIGGETGPIGAGTTQSSVYKLDLDSNTWSTAASMSTPRKAFACTLGADDFIYAIGGANDAGGTDTAEKLFTPRCPSVTLQPTSQAAWRNSLAGFSVTVSGAAPFTFQWRKDGADLVDGPTGTGSTISGAATATLSIRRPGDADAGTYDVVISNACGAVASSGAVLTLRNPPTPDTHWTVTNIHPVWADDGSSAKGIANGRIGGWATMTTTLPDGRVMSLSHPILWDAALNPTDVTPGGSVGGAILDAGGDLLGWFWHTYQCYYYGRWWTCAWQSAGFWSGDPPVFQEVHLSGAEYDAVAATDGTRMVGTVTYEYTEDNYTSYAYLWGPPNYGGQSLHPSGASDSAANAIDGDQQYGSILTPYPGPVVHAAMWSGSGHSFVDIHPAGYFTLRRQRRQRWSGGRNGVARRHAARRLVGRRRVPRPEPARQRVEQPGRGGRGHPGRLRSRRGGAVGRHARVVHRPRRIRASGNHRQWRVGR